MKIENKLPCLLPLEAENQYNHKRQVKPKYSRIGSRLCVLTGPLAVITIELNFLRRTRARQSVNDKCCHASFTLRSRPYQIIIDNLS